MKELIELANKIKNKNLREKTIDFLKNPKISNPEIIYPKANLKDAPAWSIGAHHSYEGGLLEHIKSVTECSIKLAEVLEKTYKTKINMDHLIAGALLHDMMKVFIMKEDGGQWTFTGSILDHADFTACELYARGFPEEVVHIVAAHGGESGNASPRTVEAMIVYYADVIDSSVESFVHGSTNPLEQLLMMASEKK